jgi:hypothetical protein
MARITPPAWRETPPAPRPAPPVPPLGGPRASRARPPPRRSAAGADRLCRPQGALRIGFTPTTSPCAVTNGPPELPGFRAASVWMTSSMSRPDRARRDRPNALTTPAVTLYWKPYGFPMAITTWPTRSARESPSLTGTSRAHSARSTPELLALSCSFRALPALRAGQADQERRALGDDAQVGRSLWVRQSLAASLARILKSPLLLRLLKKVYTQGGARWAK